MKNQGMVSNEEWRELARWHRGFLAADRWGWFRAVIFIDRWNRAGWFYDCLNTLGGMDMARGKSNGKPTTAKQAGGWTTFVEIPLGGAGWPEIESTFGKSDLVVETVQGLLEDGYRLSFTFNHANDSSICSVTCRAEGNPNEGKTFTAFGGNWTEALKVALYKHYVVAEQQWGDKGRQSDAPRFG